MDRYVQDGMIVCTWQTTRAQNLFQESFADASTVLQYLTIQFPCIDSKRVFLFGQSYAAGVVARCLAGAAGADFSGGVLLSPILTASSVWNDASTGCIDTEMAHVFDVPLYMQVNITDPQVDAYASVDTFTLCMTHKDSCIRCVLGEPDPFIDVVSWIRSVGKHAIQRQRTEISGSVLTSSILPHVAGNGKTSDQRPRVVQTTAIFDPFPRCVIRGIHHTLSMMMVPIRAWLHLYTPVLWEKACVHNLNITGSPVVTLCVGVPTSTMHCPVTLVLMEYNRFGYGWPISSRRILCEDQADDIDIRMSLVSTRVSGGNTLVLVLTNWETRLPRLVFKSIRLPYLYGW